MRYIQMLSGVLALLLILTATAYAAPTAEDIPEWALRPALEADEEPEDDTTTRPPTTIYDTDGSILYTDDPALLNGGDISPATLPYTVDSAELFLTKPFDKYTVTEGMLLLFLVLGFMLMLWHFVKGVF